MASLKLQNAFDELELNDKKNKLSYELIFIGDLIKKIQQFNNIESDFQIKNYGLNSNLNESETLSFLYDDVFEIEKQLLIILATLQNN